MTADESSLAHQQRDWIRVYRTQAALPPLTVFRLDGWHFNVINAVPAPYWVLNYGRILPRAHRMQYSSQAKPLDTKSGQLRKITNAKM